MTFDRIAPTILITNRSSTATISYTLDGSAPTALGDDCYVLPPGNTHVIDTAGVKLVVKLISDAGCAYTASTQ